MDRVDGGLEFSGRRLESDELDLIEGLTRDFPALSLTELSSTVCELLGWKRRNGKLKQKECRTLLERLQSQGRIDLPMVRKTSPFQARQIAVTPVSDPQPGLTGSVRDYRPLALHRVETEQQRRLWNQFIDRYHYLGFRVPFGANLRYLVESLRSPGQYLACLLFSSPAWTMAPRDAWIGWNSNIRRLNLQAIVSNSRFLILPWVSVRGLASSVLSLAARQLPQDWERRYGYRPLLLETLVDGSRFQGTCYRAANWIYLGQTQGRGRMDRLHQAHGRAVKQIYVFPLCRHVQRRLCQPAAPTIVSPPENV